MLLPLFFYNDGLDNPQKLYAIKQKKPKRPFSFTESFLLIQLLFLFPHLPPFRYFPHLSSSLISTFMVSNTPMTSFISHQLSFL